MRRRRSRRAGSGSGIGAWKGSSTKGRDSPASASTSNGGRPDRQTGGKSSRSGRRARVRSRGSNSRAPGPEGDPRGGRRVRRV
ncbi:hypothetical protein AB852_22410 [Streptomyces uncialis]|uniref:Uncharacterized protein n=1 Tax=Streptomyces uncialis TaxID=1048205 RepID=A0A1Q4V3Z4_9ACTN|nr:hypothetical protein AB852_22410 [Streptomyces uncialis]